MMVRLTILLMTLAMAGAFSGCMGGSDQPGAAGSSQGDLAPPGPRPSGNPPTATGAASCVSSDANHMCIGVKVVSYKDSNGATPLTEGAANALMDGINAIWQPCNIGFQMESYQAVDPTTYGLSYGSNSQNELPQIRQQFSDSTTFLLAATGSWTTATIAWTEMPGAAPYGTVVDADYATDPVTVGHEFGHYMGLDHDPNVGNLMYYIAYSTDKAITADQCAAARQTNQADWQAMLRH